MFKLYYTEDALHRTDEAALLSKLSVQRRAQIARRTPPARAASAAAALLLRYALADTFHPVYSSLPVIWEGKPHFEDETVPLWFNLSHTEDRDTDRFAAALLLSDEGEVGVDIEYIHTVRNAEALMRRLFLPEERAYIEKHGSPSAFFDIWCAKEAYLKWTGEGFSRPMSSVSVCMETRTAESGVVRCELYRHRIENAVLCLAAERVPKEPELQAVSLAQMLAGVPDMRG